MNKYPNALSIDEIKTILEEGVVRYNTLEFIENDPISVPHFFKLKEDIEISGFIAATLAWGNRKSIISSATKFIQCMDNSPFDFIMNYDKRDLIRFSKFVHRTFNSEDAMLFVESISNIYKNHGGLESVFMEGYKQGGVFHSLVYLHQFFFSVSHFPRSEKHLSNPMKGSAAKRLNMFLRWMVRRDSSKVDFGIWKNIPMSDLMCPLDVHSGNSARRIGILNRKQNDWKSVVELTNALKMFCNVDPVRYDFALFGAGVNDKIIVA